MTKPKTSERLLQALKEAVEWTCTLSPEEAAALEEVQRESWVRSIVGDCPLSHRMINGVRVYGPWPPVNS
jgi:hypothetical protein